MSMTIFLFPTLKKFFFVFPKCIYILKYNINLILFGSDLFHVITIAILIALLILNPCTIADHDTGIYMPNVIQVGEIISDINSGIPVNITRSIIIGDLSTCESNMSSASSGKAYPLNDKICVNVPIQIIDSEIYGSVDFSNVFFSNTVNFAGTFFKNDVKFIGTVFGRYAGFRDARFEEDAFFQNAKFLNGSDFGLCQFSNIGHFNGAQFSYYAYFRSTHFRGGAQFSGAQFNGEAYFTTAQFDNESDFRWVRFNKDAYFSETKFEKWITFEESQFEQQSDFIESIFNDDVYFKHVCFCGFSDFSNSVFYEDAYFEEVQFTDGFSLLGSRFDRLHIYWSSIKEELIYDGPTYILLIRNFKSIERFDDADRCYYQYRRINQANKDLGWSKLEDILAWLSCGYGVRPSYTIVWSFILIICFGIIFWMGKGLEEDSDHTHNRAYSSENPKQNDDKMDDFMEDSSAMQLLEYIYFSAIVYFHTHQSRGLVYSKRWSQWLILFEDIVGWLLLALFIVALANVIITW